MSKTDNLCTGAIVISLLVMPGGTPAVGRVAGTISFTGRVVDSACELSSDLPEQAADLGSISHKELIQTGKSQDRKIRITLRSCMRDGKTPTYASIRLHAPFANGRTDAIAPLGQSSGVGIQILYKGKPLVFNGTVPVEIKPTTQSGTAKGQDCHFEFVSRMVTTDASAIKAGPVTGLVNFEIAYK